MLDVFGVHQIGVLVRQLVQNMVTSEGVVFDPVSA
jgi:hypothetical protein